LAGMSDLYTVRSEHDLRRRRQEKEPRRRHLWLPP
jgi:hypothetical protein